MNLFYCGIPLLLRHFYCGSRTKRAELCTVFYCGSSTVAPQCGGRTLPHQLKKRRNRSTFIPSDINVGPPKCVGSSIAQRGRERLCIGSIWFKGGRLLYGRVGWVLCFIIVWPSPMSRELRLIKNWWCIPSHKKEGRKQFWKKQELVGGWLAGWLPGCVGEWLAGWRFSMYCLMCCYRSE